MHILVLGTTGQVGEAFVSAALQYGHELTLYVRSPSKLSRDVTNRSNVRVVEGDFDDMDAVREALSKGAEVLVSLVGPDIPHKGMPITTFYERLFALLPRCGSIRRCVILSTASYAAPEDKWSLKWWLGTTFIKIVGGSAYNEINGCGTATRSLSKDNIGWTLFRVPGLTNGEATLTRAGFVGDGGSDGLILSRKSIAIWILQELEERKWIDRAPTLCNPWWI